MSGVNAINSNTSSASASALNAERMKRKAQLRTTVDEMVGVTFFGQMLKAAHNSKLKGKYGHGGRGEEVFQGQMDLELARSMGRGMKNELSDAIYSRYEKRV